MAPFSIHVAVDVCEIWWEDHRPHGPWLQGESYQDMARDEPLSLHCGHKATHVH